MKIKKTRKMISLLQNFLGYRECPKFAIVKRYFLYKQALMKEAVLLHEKGVIQAAYRYYEKMKVPRLMTSELDAAILSRYRVW